MVDHAPQLVGFDDQPEAFRPTNRLVMELHRHHPGLRLGRTDLVFEALLPTILEQKVPGVEAWASYARLVRALGEPAPGSAGLFLPPSPRRLIATPYWAVHRFGIERRRFGVIQTAAARAARLETTASLEPAAARLQLTSLPGIGPVSYVFRKPTPDALPLPVSITDTSAWVSARSSRNSTVPPLGVNLIAFDSKFHTTC